MKGFFGRAKLAFYPRMAECEEDVAASRAFGGAILRFLDEYACEIAIVYDDALSAIRSEAHNLDVIIAGPSLIGDAPGAHLEPRTYPSGRRRHVVFLFVRQLHEMTCAFLAAHPDEDKDQAIMLSLGLTFLQLVDGYAEPDTEEILARSEELSEEIGSCFGSWMRRTGQERHDDTA